MAAITITGVVGEGAGEDKGSEVVGVAVVEEEEAAAAVS